MLTMNQRIALTDSIRKRYQNALKKKKGMMLSELVSNAGYNRSYARRFLGSKKQLGRKGCTPPCVLLFPLNLIQLT